jgi:hypothetical protein
VDEAAGPSYPYATRQADAPCGFLREWSQTEDLSEVFLYPTRLREDDLSIGNDPDDPRALVITMSSAYNVRNYIEVTKPKTVFLLVFT